MFGNVLQGLVEGTGGGIGAVLMGYDGIPVAQFFRPTQGPDLQLMAVEYTNILKEIRTAAEILDIGRTEEVAIRTERYLLVLRTLTDDYFVALTLERDGNFGKGRYLLQRDASVLRDALA
ncbi:MAG: roadblock/LC7 domain-containing protein [Desulfuromonadales bacterium]|nr:roadblock/LC7 domain-containing protein [Desulfuromonadales bacterium]